MLDRFTVAAPTGDLFRLSSQRTFFCRGASPMAPAPDYLSNMRHFAGCGKVNVWYRTFCWTSFGKIG
jgi:hypothetical protein